MLSKLYILFLLLCFSFNAIAQFTLKIEITATPSAHKQDGVFVAGSFNNWNPGDSLYRFHNENDKLVVTIKGLAAGTYQFKFTRGGWQTVEATAAGQDVENKLLLLSSDTVVNYVIDGWKDDHAAKRQHTASANVQIMDTAFAMPQLNRSRSIWIYLPKGYTTTKKHYPVMYLHDGQNLFDEASSAYGNEWGVDECLDSLIAKGKQACIVVGIDNGGETRMSEYNPYVFTWNGETRSKTFSAEGNAYLDFLTATLKPFIDKNYRTLSSRENTIIAGSSMGGLISYYAALKYPGVFGKAGVFSPAFWTAPHIKALTDSVSKKIDAKLFFYMGGKEGEQYISDMNEVAERLGGNSHTMIYSVTDAGGEHNEKAWRKWFAEFYVWMMADGYNNVIKLEQ
jgi:predicted alpha/beta superfamily hydrolase